MREGQLEEETRGWIPVEQEQRSVHKVRGLASGGAKKVEMLLRQRAFGDLIRLGKGLGVGLL